MSTSDKENKMIIRITRRAAVLLFAVLFAAALIGSTDDRVRKRFRAAERRVCADRRHAVRPV